MYSVTMRGMSGAWSAAELPHRVSQKWVEPVLLKHAQKWPSNDIRFGWRLARFEAGTDHVDAWVSPVDGGDLVHVRAQFMIGADGPRSMVRSTLGISYEGASGVKRDFMGGVMHAVYLRSSQLYSLIPHDRAWMYVAFNAERRGFLVSVDGQQEFAFHAALHEGEDGQALDHAAARELMRQVLGFEVEVDILSTQNWTAGHSLVAEKFSEGRIFLMGDAAHLFTPTGGLGYNTAVEDAVNLGWKLASVCKGISPGALLDSYGMERKRLALRSSAAGELSSHSGSWCDSRLTPERRMLIGCAPGVSLAMRTTASRTLAGTCRMAETSLRNTSSSAPVGLWPTKSRKATSSKLACSAAGS